jgi:hypothetical protein
VTQANRVLKQPERSGGFRSLAEVDDLWGLPHDVKETLKHLRPA